MTSIRECGRVIGVADGNVGCRQGGCCTPLAMSGPAQSDGFTGRPSASVRLQYLGPAVDWERLRALLFAHIARWLESRRSPGGGKRGGFEPGRLA